MEILTAFQRMTAHPGSRIATAAITALWLIMMPATTLATESLEHSVKATYLTKFGIYIEWPETAFTSAKSDINLCVTDEDPFGSILDEAARGQRIGDRAIVVRRVQNVTRNSGCHILYVGGTDTQRMRGIIESVHGSGVLTVTDARDARESMGIINFVLRDNRVRFEVDVTAAEQNNLTISSRLLGLALNLKPRN